jgi:hypothetical protein
MHGESSTDRVFIALGLIAGAVLLAPPSVQAQGKGGADAFESEEAAPVQPSPVLAPPIPSSSSDDTAVVVKSAPAAPKIARTGAPAEAGIPGWTLSPPGPIVSGLDWHGNLELDDGYVKYSWNTSAQPEVVYDSRGRFVLGPMLTHNLGDNYFLRVTGQAVAWVQESLNYYQINADDVYVQVGKQGLWDFMAGRFLTWRVFRKGLGFDLYTLEDTGARVTGNFDPGSGWFAHMYEVNTIFLRDPGATAPSARAAFHLYPTTWSGLELVGAYGHTRGNQDVLGGRLAGGINPKYFSLLVGAEYQVSSLDQRQGTTDTTTLVFVPCDKCGTGRTYGAGGGLVLTPAQEIEIAFNYAKGKNETWAAAAGAAYTSNTTQSWGGYAQLDAGSLLINRSLILGGAFFRTENTNQDDDYQRHDQFAAYLAYPLGFNNAVAKLVFSRATGYQQLHGGDTLDAGMYSVRLRFAYYY